MKEKNIKQIANEIKKITETKTKFILLQVES